MCWPSRPEFTSTQCLRVYKTATDRASLPPTVAVLYTRPTLRQRQRQVSDLAPLSDGLLCPRRTPPARSSAQSRLAAQGGMTWRRPCPTPCARPDAKGYALSGIDEDRLPPQVDGPTHFVALAGGGRRPSGATALKRRLLARAGWRVVAVPYWEWEACAGPEAQAAYLRRLLGL